MRQEITFGQYNPGVEAVKRHPDKVLEDIQFMLTKCAAVSLNEMGQFTEELEELDGPSSRVWLGRSSLRPACMATPIVYSNTKDVFNRGTYHLTPRTNTHEPNAAGPTVVHEKVLNFITFEFNKLQINFGNLHTTPSIRFAEHDDLNETQIRKTADLMHGLNGLSFTAADWNNEPEDSNLRPMREHFKSSQAAAGYKTTMKRRVIDDIYCPKHVKVVSNKVKQGIGDHKMYFATFLV